MVGLVTDIDDLGIILILTLLAPFLIIIGIPLFMSSLGLPTIYVILGALVNIGIVIYFMNRWQVMDFIRTAFQEFLQM